MIKAFVPADFAPKEDAAPPATAASAPSQVDLQGKSFLFTGKLATMTRAQSEGKVTAANGKNAGTVNAKLDYLVIGDDGSPLYGAGRKGSKQLAAEKLVGQGAAIKIISETAFLQMLAGEQRTFSADRTTAGCDTLWTMATEPGPVDAPLRLFALLYLRRHHNDISLALTDRPVDPGAEVPAEYLSFDRVKAVLADPRRELRAFALELARWELARWQPPIEAIVALCESPHAGGARLPRPGPARRRRQGARALPHRSEGAHRGRRLPLLRVARRRDARAGDGAHRQEPGPRGPRRAVPAGREPGPAGARLRGEHAWVPVPRAGDHDDVEAGTSSGVHRGRGQEGRGGQGRSRWAGAQARRAPGERRGAARLPAARAVHRAAGAAAQGGGRSGRCHGERRGGGGAAGQAGEGQAAAGAAREAAPGGDAAGSRPSSTRRSPR